MRLIDADELIEKIHIHQKITKEQAVGEIQDDEVRIYLALHIAEEFVKMLPTIEIEQKKGRWCKAYADIELHGIRPFIRVCSSCASVSNDYYNYCPNCGARMEK